jgi:hypothetical protein
MKNDVELVTPSGSRKHIKLDPIFLGNWRPFHADLAGNVSRIARRQFEEIGDISLLRFVLEYSGRVYAEEVTLLALRVAV